MRMMFEFKTHDKLLTTQYSKTNYDIIEQVRLSDMLTDQSKSYYTIILLGPMSTQSLQIV
eukprot:m.307731 g.307731  ORF g.307731 m.307731 type:complete len:60 (+) comp16463_c4_seq1:931-1110(+)